MATLGLDYAGSSPGSAAVKAAGYSFVARYLSRYAAKVITKSEYDDMTNNSVGVVLVFEDYAAQALQGYAQGVADAQVALNQANALGWPSDRPIHFAVDFDISDTQKPAAGEYMKGVISILGLPRTGAYGGYWWIKYCVDNGLASFFWQAVAWSGGQIHPSATLFQQLAGTTVNGTSCDINQALKTDYGQNNIQGGEEMITDSDNEYWRWGKLFLQIRGRAASRQEFQTYAVGSTWLKALELLSDSSESDAATVAQTLGQQAIAEDWKGQLAKLTVELTNAQNDIKTLQGQLNNQLTPSPTEPATVPVQSPPTDNVVANPSQPKQGFWSNLWHNLFG